MAQPPPSIQSTLYGMRSLFVLLKHDFSRHSFTYRMYSMFPYLWVPLIKNCTSILHTYIVSLGSISGSNSKERPAGLVYRWHGMQNSSVYHQPTRVCCLKLNFLLIILFVMWHIYFLFILLLVMRHIYVSYIRIHQ